MFAIVLKFHKTLQHGGEVGHIEIVNAFHTKRSDVTAELYPFATVVLHADVTNMVVGVAVTVNAVVFIMQVDVVESIDMSREGVFAMVGKL